MSHSVGSQQSVVPSGLPMLPGNGFKDPTKIDFKKTRHLFKKKQAPPLPTALHHPGSFLSALTERVPPATRH